MTRRCSSCNRDKPLHAFGPKVTTRSGLDGVCLVCREGMARNRAFYANECGDKVRYATSGEAAAQAAKVMRRSHAPMLRAYPCPAGDHYHLTHVERRTA